VQLAPSAQGVLETGVGGEGVRKDTREERDASLWIVTLDLQGHPYFAGSFGEVTRKSFLEERIVAEGQSDRAEGFLRRELGRCHADCGVL
jgi:hypothetical protein